MKPAARVGDQCTPPHLPPLLGPGPGMLTVHIGNKPAWRAIADFHACATPIAPPAPAPHAKETCYFGSLSVMIGNQMAVRMGDVLVGLGPPNPVLKGCLTVLIGDTGFGLANPTNMAEFCKDFAQLQKDWPKLTPEQRRQRLEKIVNRQTGKSGLPNQSVNPSAAHKPGNAAYDFTTGSLDVSEASLNSSTLNGSAAKQLANTTWHEARHAEQWHLMGRRLAGQGMSPSQISTRMDVPAAAGRAAAAQPLSASSPQLNLANSSWDSVYGARGASRNQVLGDLGKKPVPPGTYGKYRALPEEQDAWNTGDSLPCG